ncbi:hypothetical protein HRI_003975300 [Hibiscus trionum]|uniref:DUF7086 domain-containing protein n=1 Tax=Hibiscus trionum TaxID=183268 RepID=A0A9W7IWI2_HIBTR|nr:hypothetical protein HRI_003975300 [Hibiscus trionum]
MDSKRLELSLSTHSSSSSRQENLQLSYYNFLPSIDPQDQVSSPPSNCNSRKRLFSHISSVEEEHHQELLHLDLSLGPPCSPIPNPNPVVVPAYPIHPQRRSRTNSFQKLKRGKSETIDAPYPWATTRRATVHNLNYLLSQNILTISGEVECKGCPKKHTFEYNLVEKFNEIKDFVLANMSTMNDRASDSWMHPMLDNCKTCGSAMRPIVLKKRHVNWLFLLLGQKLGCCRLSELKYFCKQTKNHRTGAKNRLLYLAYIGLCKQLCPDGRFDV